MKVAISLIHTITWERKFKVGASCPSVQTVIVQQDCLGLLLLSIDMTKEIAIFFVLMMLVGRFFTVLGAGRCGSEEGQSWKHDRTPFVEARGVFLVAKKSKKTIDKKRILRYN